MGLKKSTQKEYLAGRWYRNDRDEMENPKSRLEVNPTPERNG
jgi:hypothetical protein